MSTLDRILDKLHHLFYNERRSVSFSSRFLAIAVAMVTITTVFPTLAEELTPSPEVSQSESEAPADNQEFPSPSQDPEVQPVSNESATPSPSNSEQPGEETTEEEEEPKIEAADPQPRINFRAPAAVAVDPRARVAFLPQISMTGGGIGLLCVSSNAQIDIGAKGASDNNDEGGLLVIGDNSTFLRIAGPLGSINALINAGGGLKVNNYQGRVTTSSVHFRYVELTGLDASAEFCAQSSNQRYLGFRALGLQLENVKTRVDFNKPSGR